MSEANAINLIPALSQQELQAIDAEIAHVPYRDAVAIDALKIVQAHRVGFGNVGQFFKWFAQLICKKLYAYTFCEILAPTGKRKCW